MANDIAKFFGGHQLPDRKKQVESLAALSAAKNALTGKALLKMDKSSGVWNFGVDNEKLAHGTVLIANPASLQSGYIAWYQAKVEGEVMQSHALGPVDPQKLGPVNSGSVPPGKKLPSGKGWETQVSIDLITRSDIPLSLVYKTSSVGGLKAILTLAGEISFGMNENPARVYPLVEIGVDSYEHKEFGTVYTPVLAIIGWLDEAGNEVKDMTKIAGKNSLL